MLDPQLSSQATIGPYTLLRKLGQGGMGVVWLGYDQALDRHVAIKELRQSGAKNSTLLRRLVREAQAAAKLNHPNTVTIYQIIQERQSPCVVMEYVDGGSLAEHLQDHGAMGWRAATQAIRDAAAGLRAAHEGGIVHRDIKPANLLRTKRGLVKLADFGLARWAELDVELTHPGAFLGSPAYVSPEQAAGRKADARSDIYSLMCTYYALLTRTPPFVDEDAAVILERHEREVFPDPRAVAGAEGLPDGVCRILLKGSQKRPGDRYGSAGELLAELDAVLATPDQSHTFAGPWGRNKERQGPRDSVPEFHAEQPDLHVTGQRLARARKSQDKGVELEAWRELYGHYSQAGQTEAAADAYRRAVALYVQVHAPSFK